MSRKERILDIVQHVLEVLIIVLLIIGGVSLFFADPVNSGGPVARLIGSQAAAYFYGIVFIAEGLGLTLSKTLRRKKFHKNMLLIIYLTLLFTILLEIALVGFGIEVIDNIVASVAAGWCWIRWKFKTEYIDPTEFYEATSHLRDDLPPHH